MTYFLADPHYGHNREFIWKERGFNNIEEHNVCLLESCKKLTTKDVLYIVGDVLCGRNSLENALEFLNKLKCKVVVIKGNHDDELFKKEDFLNKNIRLVNTVCLDIKLNGYKLTLSHYPMLSWNASHWNSINLYGHVHNKKLPIEGKMLDVAPIANHMFPYSFEEIIKIMENKKNNWDFIETVKKTQ